MADSNVNEKFQCPLCQQRAVSMTVLGHVAGKKLLTSIVASCDACDGVWSLSRKKLDLIKT